MYKTLKSNLPELEKRIRAIGRKLNKYGLKWNFKVISESIEKIGIYEIHPNTGIYCRVGETIVEVVSYEFDMEQLKLKEWTPVAIIEHGAVCNNGVVENMIHPINDAEILPEWWNVNAKCEHCDSNRRRNKTVILKNDNGTYKQVGTACVKDFTGIDAIDVIKIYASIKDVKQEEPCINSSSNYKSPYIDTVNYLACCVDEINQNGYRKDLTKSIAYKLAKTSTSSEESIQVAQNMINFFENLDSEYVDSFVNNIKTVLINQYSTISGLIAYAPVMYSKLTIAIQEAEKTAIEKSFSDWQGVIGNKITASVKYVNRFSYETIYGTQYICLFKDESGNIYKWNTAKFIDDIDKVTSIAGTIKAHDEYNEQKQTVLTRCKVTYLETAS